jgi:uncharacterized membrane protein YhaH (DUF805 family)
MDVKQLLGNFKTVVTQRYADFNGRASRSVFWQYILVYVVIAVLLALLGLRLVVNLIHLALFLPTLAVCVRRLHDLGKSGWLVLLPLIPGALLAAFIFIFWPLAMVAGFAGLICTGYLIYLYAQPSAAGSNQFGPEPGALAA